MSSSSVQQNDVYLDGVLANITFNHVTLRYEIINIVAENYHENLERCNIWCISREEYCKIFVKGGTTN